MEEKRKPTIGELREILSLLGMEAVTDGAITAFTSDEDGAEYAVWRIDADPPCVLKRAKAYELPVYRSFFAEKKPYVPALLGSCTYNGDDYFLTEYVPLHDLRICDRKRLVPALDALVASQEEYWQREDLYDVCVTMDMAKQGIENRGKYLGSDLLERAYAAFQRVFSETPRTLCHDDLLPINVLADEERAVLIDWEYGGVLPYLSAFARLIAHGREDRNAYFYLSREDRGFAIEYYYEHLPKKHGIAFSDYRRALDHFLFYEYCEWIMLGNRYDARDDERFGYCLQLANALAPQLIR